MWKSVGWLTDPRCSIAKPNISGSEIQEQGGAGTFVISAVAMTLLMVALRSFPQAF
jgi:hypothetical protein